MRTELRNPPGHGSGFELKVQLTAVELRVCTELRVACSSPASGPSVQLVRLTCQLAAALPSHARRPRAPFLAALRLFGCLLANWPGAASRSGWRGDSADCRSARRARARASSRLGPAGWKTRTGPSELAFLAAGVCDCACVCFRSPVRLLVCLLATVSLCARAVATPAARASVRACEPRTQTHRPHKAQRICRRRRRRRGWSFARRHKSARIFRCLVRSFSCRRACELLQAARGQRRRQRRRQRRCRQRQLRRRFKFGL